MRILYAYESERLQRNLTIWAMIDRNIFQQDELIILFALFFRVVRIFFFFFFFYDFFLLRKQRNRRKKNCLRKHLISRNIYENEFYVRKFVNVLVGSSYAPV